MPAADWDVYRLGARLPSLVGLVTADARDQIDRLQRALSAVAVIESRSRPLGTAAASDDARFVGRLLLGLLGRGWPTFSSPVVEGALLAALDPGAGLRAGDPGHAGQIGWRLDRDGSTPPGAWDAALQGALLRGDRRLGVDEAVIATLTDSVAEQDFYRDHLAPLLGQAIGWLELQRPIASMVREDPPDPKRVGAGRVDFALDLPGSPGAIRLVIELDGPHHGAPAQSAIDDNRDRLLDKHDWQTLRVPVRTLDDGSLNYLPGRLRAIIEHHPFPFTDIEGDAAALDDPRQREATRLILTPHAVARVQLALCRALVEGELGLAATEWTVAVVEREVPCAELAVRDWLGALTHLCALYSIPVAVERVRLLVAEEHLARFPRPSSTSEPAAGPSVLSEPLTEGGELQLIELGIDVSVDAHPTRRYPTDPLAQANLLVGRRIALRTAQRQSGYTVEPWPEPRPIARPLAHKASLVYFLGAVFRKRTFLEGQLPIIERVLRREDVIGLLPTGAGKSICFQLPALLSPGLALVIDPIKSLMQDQVENLAAAGVMDAIQINSDTPKADRAKIEWQFGQGEYRLVFISPERLQVKDFRDRLAATADKRPVAAVVIDEAHCVSEWGHDFRTAYLNLGRIAGDSCARDGIRPPLVALTGTASEAVLRDIQRELGVEEDEAIVRPGRFAREELNFEIVPVPAGRKGGSLVHLLSTVIPRRLGVDRDDLASGACGGIVFCPHVNGSLGVHDVSRSLERTGLINPSPSPSSPYTFYSGEAPKKIELSDEAWSRAKAQTQRAFKSGEIPLLVATSAFGMGIDKPNIRYTVHYAMAKSVEAFAQEAGRAGRDRKAAVCAVLFTDGAALAKDGAARPAADCLERGIAVEEAAARAAAFARGDDDAALQIYLHTRGYQGMRRESAAIRAFFHEWIEPHLPAGPDLGGQAVEVAIAEPDYRARIEELMVPLLPEGKEPAGDAGSVQPSREGSRKEDVPRPDLQRLIYRLALLGIVADYTVAYRPDDNVYTLSAVALDDEAVEDRLRGYVARYRTAERARMVEERLRASALPAAVDRCIDTLCWFVYEEIEQRRRQAMENMRTMLRESSDGADFARRLNKTLSNSALTRDVFDVLRTDDVETWGEIAREISSADSAEHVYYQCRRALEDAPDHPGLLLLIGLALQGTEGERRAEVVENLRYGLRQARRALTSEERRRMAGWLVPELARIAPTAAPAVLDRVIRDEADPALAGAVLRSVELGALNPDPILLRTSQRSLLRSIDARLERFMSA